MKKSQETRIIFLDIDGVLNSNAFYVDFYKKHDKKEITNDIDPKALLMIDQLCKDIKAVVVISSCWRIGNTIDEIQKTFNDMGATFKIIGFTPVIGYSMCRGLEIQEWISKNMEYDEFGYDNYVIIDDDSDFFIRQQKHFFQTDNMYGITSNTCYRIRRFFKTKKEVNNE